MKITKLQLKTFLVTILPFLVLFVKVSGVLGGDLDNEDLPPRP